MPLRLMTVHAHPDDEASKGPGSVGRYSAEGIACVLVCCTGGEEGDILNPSMDRPEVRENLHAVRLEELRRSAELIGYSSLELLGYRDSGMPESEANSNPASFAAAPLDEAVGRLVGLIRKHRPQVLVCYGDRQEFYPHPDHLRVHEIAVAAFDAAADDSLYLDAGEPWAVSKLYYTVWSMRRMRALHDKFLELGLESPFSEAWFERENLDSYITTRVKTEGFSHLRREALLAHATQVDPTSPFWFGLPPDVADAIDAVDDYVLAQHRLGPGYRGSDETDLFEGLRQPEQASV